MCYLVEVYCKIWRTDSCLSVAHTSYVEECDLSGLTSHELKREGVFRDV
jgi:hypothetical protein